MRSRTEEDSLRLLLDSNVDYTLMDELVVQYIVSNYAEEARTRLQFGSTPLLTRQLYLAVRRSCRMRSRSSIASTPSYAA